MKTNGVLAGIVALSLLAMAFAGACGQKAPAPSPAPSPAVKPVPAPSPAAASPGAKPAPAPSPAPAPAAKPAAKPATQRTINVAYIGDFTGPSASGTRKAFNISSAYYKWFNESNYIPGLKINYLTEDNRYDPSKTVIGYKKILSENPMVIYTMASQDAAVLSPIVAKDTIPLVTTSADTLVIDPPGWVFVLNGLWDSHVISILNWIEDTWDMQKMGRKARYASLGWDNTAHNSGVKPAQIYAQKLKKVEWISAEIAPAGTMDFTTYVLRLKDKGADYIWSTLLASPLASAIKTGIQIGIPQSKWIITDISTFQWEIILSALGKSGTEGMLNITSSMMYVENTLGHAKMKELWTKNYPNEPLPANAQGLNPAYAAAATIVEALRMAVQDVGIEKLDSVAVYRALQKIKGFETGGVQAISFDTERRVGPDKHKMYIVRDGDMTVQSTKLYPYSPAVKDLLAEAAAAKK